MLESKFEKEFIQDLKDLFPGCIILKNNSAWRQGIPDRVIFWGPHYAFFELKRSRTAKNREPNQEYYVDILDQMSFAAFVYPENKETVLNALQSAFGA